ncbi:MAG: hypothetical protein NT124_01615 [Candidatus Dependentiae bacterium]|nr:hypothetical protein [Candidatus Dependentiae bacterium]
MAKALLTYFSPGRMLLFSIVCTIAFGTALLALPQASIKPISLIDLIFTATSATCVTGLFTIPLEQFTVFGHSIILLLMQIGGIGIITMSLFFMSLFMDFGLSTQLMARHVLELESWKNIKKLLVFSISMTFAVELIGALCVMITIAPTVPFTSALFLSLFHSVSSFCNAGISIFQHTPHAFYETNTSILLITMTLMFIGGLGFITWHEIMRYLQTIKTTPRRRFSLHSKIILYGTGFLFLFSAFLLYLLERNNLFANMSGSQKVLHVLFHAVSFKGSGFLLSAPHTLRLATLLLIMMISFIGSAPGSTGSGVKITTIAIFFATIRSVLLGRTAVEIRGRQIALDQVIKSIAIIALSSCWIMFTCFCLSITEPQWSFFDILSETFAACTNLGISTGVSAHLSSIGKLFIIASMLIGRIGAIGFILALRLKLTHSNRTFSYPEERVMLG